MTDPDHARECNGKVLSLFGGATKGFTDLTGLFAGGQDTVIHNEPPVELGGFRCPEMGWPNRSVKVAIEGYKFAIDSF